MARFGLLGPLKKLLPSKKEALELGYAGLAGGLGAPLADMLLDRAPFGLNSGMKRTMAQVALGLLGGRALQRYKASAGYGFAGAVVGAAVSDLVSGLLGRAKGTGYLAQSPEPDLVLGPDEVSQLPGAPDMILGQVSIETETPAGFSQVDVEEDLFAGYLS